MDIIVGGQLENAMIFHLDQASTRGLEWGEKGDSPYHEYRTLPRSYFRELGLFLTLATQVRVPNHYWKPPRIRGYNPSPFPIVNNSGFGSNTPCWALTLRLLRDGVLSQESISRLSLSADDLDRYEKFRPFGSQLPTQEDVVREALYRLMIQVEQAGEMGERLVLTLDDYALLKQISAHIAAKEIAVPFAFPDLSGPGIATTSSYGGGILEFNPIDGQALAAVCSDKLVKAYAAEVRRHLDAAAPTADTETDLLGAMRRALQIRDQMSVAEHVFEIANWLMKPLPFFFGLPLDGAKMALAREKKKVEWFKFASVTSQVAIEDYLKRKDNIPTSP